MKRDYLINLNTAVDLIWELGQSGKIDRETESLFIQVLYQTKDYKKRKKRSLSKIDTLNKPEINSFEFMETVLDTLKESILKYEFLITKLREIKPASPEERIMITALYSLINKCSVNCLGLREFILDKMEL